MTDISVNDMRENQAIIAQYGPPTDLTPAEVGLLYDNKFADREVTATIIDLAMRGFMAIRKVPRRHLFGEYAVYEFELLREDAGVLELKLHEQAVLNGLFGVVGSMMMDKIHADITSSEARDKIERYYADQSSVSMIGNRICIDELQPYFYQYVSQAYTAAHANLKYEGYFTHGSPLAGWSTLLLGAGAIIAALLDGRLNYVTVVLWMFAAICVFVGSVLLVSTESFARRAPLGDKAKQYLEGFILYLKTAEVDRLERIQTPNTVEQKAEGIKLYKTYLPYAIALGLEDDWTKKFQSAYAESPIWITGDDKTTAADLQKSVTIALRQTQTG